MAYSLTYSSSTVREGNQITFNLIASDLPDGTLVPFSISGVGINLFDFTGISSLSGNFLMQNGRSSVVFKIAEDFKTEGPETLVLRLTGRNESIAVVIQDNSVTSGGVANLFITVEKPYVYEGSPIIFNISGIGVPAGTSVPYSIIGLDASSVYNTPINGNVIFTANTSYDTAANVRIQTIIDDATQGPRNVVLLLYPTFSYTLQISGTSILYDSSLNNTPKYVISYDKQKVVEGSNITFAITGTNTPAGSTLQYRIVPWTSWDQPSDLYPASNLEPADFIGLTSLYGTVPAFYEPYANAKSNLAYITFQVKDDFIYEPPEYFYLTVVDPNTGIGSGSGIIQIVDSGNTLISAADVFTGNVEVSFLESAVLSANIGGISSKLGYYKDATGQLSDSMVLQGKTPYSVEDSVAYYQPFSYVIRSSISIDEWMNSVKGVLHPAGFTVFSEINNETSVNRIPYAGIKAVEDSEINTYSPITSDLISGLLNVSNTVIRGELLTSLTTDLVYLLTNP